MDPAPATPATAEVVAVAPLAAVAALAAAAATAAADTGSARRTVRDAAALTTPAAPRRLITGMLLPAPAAGDEEPRRLAPMLTSAGVLAVTAGTKTSPAFKVTQPPAARAAAARTPVLRCAMAVRIDLQTTNSGK